MGKENRSEIEELIDQVIEPTNIVSPWRESGLQWGSYEINPDGSAQGER
jgi:hypothetical protein